MGGEGTLRRREIPEKVLSTGCCGPHPPSGHHPAATSLRATH